MDLDEPARPYLSCAEVMEPSHFGVQVQGGFEPPNLVLRERSVHQGMKACVELPKGQRHGDKREEDRHSGVDRLDPGHSDEQESHQDPARHQGIRS